MRKYFILNLKKNKITMNNNVKNVFFGIFSQLFLKYVVQQF